VKAPPPLVLARNTAPAQELLPSRHRTSGIPEQGPSRSLMPPPPTALEDDVISNQIALRNAEAQAATRLIARNFLGNLAGDDDDEVDDMNDEEKEFLTIGGDL
jgi:hypothetical protein